MSNPTAPRATHGEHFDPQVEDLVTSHYHGNNLGKLRRDAKVWRVVRRTPAMVFLRLEGGDETDDRRKRRTSFNPWGLRLVSPEEYAAMMATRDEWIAWRDSVPETDRVQVLPHGVVANSQRDPARLRRDAETLNAIADWLEREP